MSIFRPHLPIAAAWVVSITTIASVLGVGIITMWWLSDDRPVVAITGVELVSPVKTERGARMIYKFTVHKLRDCPGDWQIDIDGPARWEISQPYLGWLKVGQKKTETYIMNIPDFAPKGEYTVNVFSRHQCNPLRTEVSEATPLSFKIGNP